MRQSIEHSPARRQSATQCFGFLSIVVFGSVMPSSAMPASRASDSEIARCIRQAANGKEWLEKTLWGLRDQEGGWIGAAVRNSNGSHDLGPLQVNSWWVPKVAAAIGHSQQEVRYWLQYDACFNVQAARWIFLSGLGATRDYWKAVGIYHSPTVWRQQRYTVDVAAHLRRRFGMRVFER